jgi:hypothetical protein
MTGLMDKAIAKLIKVNLIDMESFSTHIRWLSNNAMSPMAMGFDPGTSRIVHHRSFN